MLWENQLQSKLDQFKLSNQNTTDAIPISIKIRVTGGCFHRKHSPNAYTIIDEYLLKNPLDNAIFEEHETGPELLVLLAFLAAGAELTAGVINFVSEIIKARKIGIKRGDTPKEHIELIIRGFDVSGKFKEELVLKIDSENPISAELIKSALKKSAKLFLKDQK
jgi:hypothetical protein